MTAPAPGTARSPSVAGALRWLGARIPWRSRLFWSVVLVNAVLIVLYLWSRGGTTIDLRVEANGTTYRAFAGERLLVAGTLDGPPVGGIALGFGRERRVASLPEPWGYEWVKVTDLDTEEVLFEDDFGDGPSDQWSVEYGDWSAHDGVYSSTPSGLISLGSQPWRNYAVEVRLRNPMDANIYFRMQDTADTALFGVRSYRNYDSAITLLDGGQPVDRLAGGGPHLDRSGTLQSIIAMVLRPYPVALLMIVGAAVFAFAVRVAPVERSLRALGGLVAESAGWFVAGLGIAAVFLLWYLLYVVGENIPNVPDSVLYVFQSKIFASFQIAGDAPPSYESFDIFRPHMMQLVDGRWFSHYPFGHPLFLAVGQVFHVPWLVPPLLGAGCVGLIYGVGKRVYGVAVGLVATVVLFFSPFFQMTASNFMSHNTAAFVILACLFFLTRPLERRRCAMFLSGLCLGLLFNIRPLPAVAIMPPLGLFLGYELLTAGDDRPRVLRELLAFAAGGLVMLLAYFLYNQATTGEFLTSPYALQGTYDENTFGFGGRHSTNVGLQNEQALLSLMILVANGWPVYIGLAFGFLPFIMGTHNRWDFLLGACALAIAGAQIMYVNSAIMHGPRFWYETMPFLMLLTARGVVSLRDVGSALGDWLARRAGWFPSVSSTATTSFAVFSLVAGLVAFSSWGWLLENRTAWTILFMPSKISQLEGFNYTDPRLLDVADEMDMENALIFVNACPQWWCYGSVFWTNAPGLDGDVVWASRHTPVEDRLVLDHYPERDVYIADYDQATIERSSREEILGGSEPVPTDDGNGTTPQATPTPAPTLTAEGRAQALARDRTRRQDLETISAALEQYAAANGSYPFSKGQVQTLCVYQGLDAGCEISEFLEVIPTDPLRGSYWYVSDGESYTLFAQQEAATRPNEGCPAEVPHLVNAGTLYCVSSGPG